MKKYNQRPGSLVLMVLIVMTILVIIVHGMARCSSYLVILAHERTTTD
jgi:hypothetical protein